MVGKTLLDAGTIVLVLSALFVGLLTLAVVLSIGWVPGVDATAEHIADLRAEIIDWARLVFGALLGALGVKVTDRRPDDDD